MKKLRVKLSLKHFDAQSITHTQAAKIKGGTGEAVEGTEIVIVDTIVS